MFIRRLYLCGGGTNTIALAGALECLEQRGLLEHIKEWMGISAGALAAMCLAAGYSVAELKRFWLEFDFEAITDPDIASGWFVNLGYDTGNRLQRLVNALLKEKGFADIITFEQLTQATGLSLRVFATNINKGVLEEFSDTKTPSYSVAHAVRASMTLPYYFQPFICPITGDTYMDGGVITNYPFNYLTEEVRNETLGLLITYSATPIHTLEFQDFIMRPLSIYMQGRSHSDYCMFSDKTVRISLDSGSPVEFGMPIEKRQEMIRLGFKSAQDFLKNHRKPVRRYSVA